MTHPCAHAEYSAKKFLEHLAAGCPRALPTVAAWAARLLLRKDWKKRVGII